MRKDQKRRLKYQEKQRLQQQAIKTQNNYLYGFMTKGELEKSASKLVR